LSIAVVCLALSLIWLVKWILNKLIPVIENNTSAFSAMLKSDEENREVIANNTKAINDLTTEHKVLTSMLKK